MVPSHYKAVPAFVSLRFWETFRSLRSREQRQIVHNKWHQQGLCLSTLACDHPVFAVRWPQASDAGQVNVGRVRKNHSDEIVSFETGARLNRHFGLSLRRLVRTDPRGLGRTRSEEHTSEL